MLDIYVFTLGELIIFDVLKMGVTLSKSDSSCACATISGTRKRTISEINHDVFIYVVYDALAPSQLGSEVIKE